MQAQHYKLLVPLLLHSLLWCKSLYGYDIDGSKWFGATTEFHVNMQGSSASGVSWNTAFVAALNDWNEGTRFNFVLADQDLDPCLTDGLNSVDFTSELCGSEFQDSTLAVAIRSFQSQILGPLAVTEADIVINESKNFNVYDGRFGRFGFPGIDFRRVALHELGHVIGLGHDDTVPTIMSTRIGNIDRITEDDIAGVEALYSGLEKCSIKQLRFGSVSDSLASSDCTVEEMTVGEGDTSFIDLYAFELDSATTVSFSMTSSNLDSVLILADQDLRYLAYDDKSTDQCDSTLSTTLQPGSYFLLSNTFDIPVKEECGNLGAYVLNASYSSQHRAGLGSSASLNGGFASATFSGGISADNGQSFGNQFSANQSLDISATIDVDSDHVGQSGFLVVAAVVGEQILFLNENSEFVDSVVNPGLIVRHRNLELSAEQSITLANNLVPADLGIQQIEVNLYTGYGLANDPEELYFNQIPLNLTINPAAAP